MENTTEHDLAEASGAGGRPEGVHHHDQESLEAEEVHHSLIQREPCQIESSDQCGKVRVLGTFV